MGYGLAWFYSREFNPEIKFWRSAFEEKQEWAKSIRGEKERVIVFSGGSTTAFQFDSALLKDDYNLDTINAGMHAGAGLDGTVAIATSLLQPGDHLILTTEPGALAGGGGKMTRLGSQLVTATNADDDGFFQEKLIGRTLFERLAAQRPDLYHTVTMIGKLLTGRSLYRYESEDINRGGMLSTPIRIDHASEGGKLRTPTLSERGRKFLKELNAWAEKRGIRVSYLMPVYYTPDRFLDEQRKYNQRFLNQVSEIVPVIQDRFIGADPEPSNFADTGMHMTSEAAKARTNAVAEALTSYRYQNIKRKKNGSPSDLFE